MKTLINFIFGLIAKWIYLFLVWTDKKLNKYERFDYETAPYCGHHHCGHDGYFTKSHFHESDGGGKSKGWFHRYILGVWYSNVDGHDYGFHVPVYLYCRWFYYDVKRIIRYSSIKIQYPHGKRTLYINILAGGHFKYNSRFGYHDKVSTLHIIRLSGFIPVSHNTIRL